MSKPNTGAETYATVYQYDRNNRLTKEQKQTRDALETRWFRYDNNGNQTVVEWEQLQDAVYGSGVGRVGFVTEEFHSDDVSLDLREYNGFHQLVKVYRDSIQTLYRYRPDGLRHSKSIGSAHKRRTQDRTTVHHWDGQNIVLDVATNGNSKSRYLRGVNLVAQQIDANDFYYLFNAHGDVVQRVGSTGIAAPEYVYDTFGNQREMVETDPNPFRYCGEYFDLSSGTYYLRARYYNPVIGRFISEDIARDGLNWYTYCGNNPVTFHDPTGCYYVVLHGSEYSVEKQSTLNLLASSAVSAIPVVGNLISKAIAPAKVILGGTSNTSAVNGVVLNDKIPKTPNLSILFKIMGSAAAAGMRSANTLVNKGTIADLDNTLWALMDLKGLSSNGFTDLGVLVNQMDNLHGIVDSNPDYFGAYASFQHDAYVNSQFMEDYKLYTMTDSQRTLLFEQQAANYAWQQQVNYSDNFAYLNNEYERVRMARYNQLLADYNKRMDKMKSY